jgi:guanylate kinase
MTISLKRKSMLVVLSAPSGGGKSTVTKALLNRVPELEYSVSVTSRLPRGDEKEGINYHYVTEAEFRRLSDQDEFYEWALVHGNFYGTRKSIVQAALQRGNDVILDIDVQGACSIKKLRPDALTIFLLPPSLAVLEKRLRGRETDSEETIQLRLKNAIGEIAHYSEFDYVVVNEDLERAIAEISSIFTAERHRRSRVELALENEVGVQKALRNI